MIVQWPTARSDAARPNRRHASIASACFGIRHHETASEHIYAAPRLRDDVRI